jgi:hypothetical protein
LKWYKDSHSTRGWSVFMDQMQKFIDWLEKAEEGKYDELCLLTCPTCVARFPGFCFRFCCTSTSFVFVALCYFASSSPYPGERAQHSALSDSTLWSAAGLTLNPWLLEEDEARKRITLAETAERAVAMAVQCAEDGESSISDTIGLLLSEAVAGSRKEDVSKDIWRLTERVLDFRKEDDDDILADVWHRCLCGSFNVNVRVAAKLLKRRKDLFFEALEDFLLNQLKDEDEDEDEEGSRDWKTPLTNVLSSDAELFSLATDYAVQYLSELDYHPIFAESSALSKIVVDSIPTEFHAVSVQHLVALLSTDPGDVGEDNLVVYMDLILKEWGLIKPGRDLFLLFVIARKRKWLERLLRYSAEKGDKFHVAVVPEGASIHELM